MFVYLLRESLSKFILQVMEKNQIRTLVIYSNIDRAAVMMNESILTLQCCGQDPIWLLCT